MYLTQDVFDQIVNAVVEQLDAKHAHVQTITAGGAAQPFHIGYSVASDALDAALKVHGVKVVTVSVDGEPANHWAHYFDVPDSLAEKALNARVPGGSSVRDWFLPHDSEKAEANVRDAMKCALLATRQQAAEEPTQA